MIEAVRLRAARALLFGRALRGSGAVRPVGPAALARFLDAARRVKLGPHLAVMFHAAAQPEREALVEYGAAGVRRLTWRELDAAINRLAHALVARGVRGGGRVALMLPNGSEYLIAQQAIARLGATAVQIGYRLKAGEIAYILERAAPAATIVHADHLAELRAARAQARRADPMITVSGTDSSSSAAAATDATPWDAALAAAPAARPPRVDGGDGGGVIIYTSGTTGRPKGANRAWKTTGMESVADLVLQVGMRADDRHLAVCPLYHSAAPAFVAIMMSLGATTVLMNHFEPEGALAIIARERITCSLVVPTMLVRIAGLPEEVIARHDTSSLRWIMSGAAPLATEVARRFMARFGPILWNFYGATETGLVTLAGPADHLARPGTIGRALHGNAIDLLDDAGRPVPRGAVGELFVRNSTLIAGYDGDDAATRASQRAGAFSVGDLARADADGYYYLESRKHDLVISGGVNIYPREIEDHLHTHPGILEAAVVGVPDPEWGESLRAFVVPRPGASLTEAEVIDFCRRGLADYKRPRRVTFLGELPRNPTGKVVKRELRER